MSKVSRIDALRIQARAVIPIVKALERELGAERAHRLVGDALAGAWADYAEARPEGQSPHPRSAGGFDFPVESIIVRDSADEHAVNMTRCEFADFFRSIGEPEIGALMTCGVDYEVERRLRPDWRFTRTRTLMQGAGHCDFRWRRKDADADD